MESMQYQHGIFCPDLGYSLLHLWRFYYINKPIFDIKNHCCPFLHYTMFVAAPSMRQGTDDAPTATPAWSSKNPTFTLAWGLTWVGNFVDRRSMFCCKPTVLRYIPLLSCRIVRGEDQLVLLQAVRWRKRRWSPKSMTKTYYVREPTYTSPEESAELKKRYDNYHTTMRALRCCLRWLLSAQGCNNLWFVLQFLFYLSEAYL